MQSLFFDIAQPSLATWSQASSNDRDTHGGKKGGVRSMSNRLKGCFIMS